MSELQIAFEAQLERDDELQRMEVEPDSEWRRMLEKNGYKVKAEDLKLAILGLFDEGSPLMELEPESDEDESFELKGFENSGKSKTIPDNETVDLKRYKAFRVTPRPVAG